MTSFRIASHIAVAALAAVTSACSLAPAPAEIASPDRVQWDLDWAEGATFAAAPLQWSAADPVTETSPLARLRQSLDAFNDGDPSTDADLGVDGLCLSSRTAHGARATHASLDPRLGSAGELDELLRAAHTRQLRVLVDLELDVTDADHAARELLWWLDRGVDGARLQAICPGAHPATLGFWQHISKTVRQRHRDALLIGSCRASAERIAAHFGSTLELRRGDGLPSMLQLPYSRTLVEAVRAGNARMLRSALIELDTLTPAGALNAITLDEDSVPLTTGSVDDHSVLDQVLAAALTLPGTVLIGPNLPNQQETQRTLETLRDLIQTRSSSPALRRGTLELIPDAPDELILLLRRHPKQSVLVAQNLGGVEITAGLALPIMQTVQLAQIGAVRAEIHDRTIEITLGPHSTGVWELQLRPPARDRW